MTNNELIDKLILNWFFMPFQIHFQFIDRKFFKKVQNFNFAIDYLYFLCYT